MFIRKKMYAIAFFLLVIGGINWGIMAVFGRDGVSMLFGKSSIITSIIFVLVAAAALGIGFSRDNYLPFLGPSVMPCSLLKVQTPEGADTEVQVRVKPGAKVLYWAAEPENKDLEGIQTWKDAYLGYKNAGVAIADDNGYVSLRVRKPQAYGVPMRSGGLPKHIHYRVCGDNGFIDRVMTVRLDGREMFENYVSRETHPQAVLSNSRFEYVKPSYALSELNRYAIQTLANSPMASDFALDESPQTAGAPFSVYDN